MKAAHRKDDELLAEIAACPSSPDEFDLWWLGQSGFLIRYLGRHLLFDPYLSDSLTEKYATSDKPHVRMTERVVDPARLGFVDIVTSSHNHTDHLDAETLSPIVAARSDVVIVVPEANTAFAAKRLGLAVDRLTAARVGRPVRVAGFDLIAVPSAHETLDKDDEGRHLYVGYIARFGPFCVYHSGDTVLWDGLTAMLARFPIDVAFLPINGRAPQRRVAGNLSGPEAAAAAREMGARCAIPCHYDMFEFNTADPGPFVEECERRGQEYRVLSCGGHHRVTRR